MSRFPSLAIGALLCLYCLCGTTGCSFFSTQPKRGTLAAKMMNLSAAVESYFSGLAGPPLGMEDKEILELATEHDDELLAREFKRYPLKVDYQAGHAVLLLCNKDGDRALMEDVGCSAALDRKAFDQKLPCAFTLKVNAACEVEYTRAEQEAPQQ